MRWLAALVACLWLAALGRDWVDDWVAATVLPPLSIATGAEVLARDGTLLRAYQVGDGLWRLSPGAVDPFFTDLLLTYEDKGFYDHHGVDYAALTRALGQALWNGRVVSGGSTLTMQVARLLEGSGTGQWAGKLRQVRLAWALEARLSKGEILQLYLTLAPYGGNVEGIRAASILYFGKEPRRLTPAEAALLVAIPQSPEARRPDRHPKAAEQARARVLDRALGDGLIDADQAQAARTEQVPAARRPFPMLAPHLADRVIAEGGRQTTIDATLQAALERLAAASVPKGERMQVAILVADHATGEILASVGSAGYGNESLGFIDMTQALRSPGSTLKPLVYGLAFDEGLGHPETLIEDKPTDFAGYRPQNFDRMFRGWVRLRDALQLSLNIPVVMITEALGPAKLLQAMDRAGMVSRLPSGQPGLAVALGGVGVSLQDMVQLYAAIARGGVARPLTHGAPTQDAARVLTAVSAWQVGDILAGLAPPPGAPSNRLAYKTGTSYGHRDTWAIGFDGAHVVGVWMGRADGTPMPGAFGADLAAPVLFQAFARLKPELAPQPPAPPETLMLATSQLPQPLQKFRSRQAAFTDTLSPKVTFPPDGAEVELLPEGLMVRVEGGTAPYTWLRDGAPAGRSEEPGPMILPDLGRGFVTLTVIDAEGRSARTRVRLR
ncbi:penicillin-binding protein 1C [Rhodobacter sp. KR11]|uniref:penicillin-binding protein 1C n=1 Tax=Rhodobacter sp. KR11 TaxID=2974588 RepID=UPI002221B586|nr:penicillin-binding protein 1C [Rhodobacter sp. KR11]MCW1918217.1 penicillin-binding protein 1C [Rhodobacter sp. KR11]